MPAAAGGILGSAPPPAGSGPPGGLLATPAPPKRTRDPRKRKAPATESKPEQAALLPSPTAAAVAPPATQIAVAKDPRRNRDPRKKRGAKKAAQETPVSAEDAELEALAQEMTHEKLQALEPQERQVIEQYMVSKGYQIR